jgi:hypothetical protein
MDQIVALVVPRGPAQHKAVLEHRQRWLPVERWPDAVYYVLVLPNTAASKLGRAQVRTIVMGEIARRGTQQLAAPGSVLI